jgi:hypothetical protein
VTSPRQLLSDLGRIGCTVIAVAAALAWIGVLVVVELGGGWIVIALLAFTALAIAAIGSWMHRFPEVDE